MPILSTRCSFLMTCSHTRVLLTVASRELFNDRYNLRNDGVSILERVWEVSKVVSSEKRDSNGLPRALDKIEILNLITKWSASKRVPFDCPIGKIKGERPQGWSVGTSFTSLS
jgi:hypothetical protein